MKLRVVFLVMFLTGLCLWGQTPTGQILGTVKDPSGLPVPDAVVAVTNQGTGQRVEVRSGATGDYLVPALVPGQYHISIEKEGFKKFIRQGVSVTSFQNVRVDAALDVGAVTQTVVVTGEAPLVDTRSSAVGALVDDKRITDLPLNGRNIISFASLIPGVTRSDITAANSVSFGQQRVNINGNRAYSTNMQLDGGSMFYAHRGQSLNMPPPDAIQEINVVALGVTAEYGRGTAVLSAVTKSGTNDFHGSLWDYFRNDALDARRMFDRTKAKLRYNQFGGTLGGPVLHNRLFFFGSFQGIRSRQERSATTARPPTAAERAGDFSASNPAPMDPLSGQPFPNRTIPTGRLDPVAVKLLDKIPLPNSPDGRLSALTPTPTSGDNIIGKFDHSLTSRDRLSFRYYFDYLRGLDAFPVVVSPGSNIPDYSPSPTSTDIQSLTLNHTRTWGPSLLTTSRGSFTRFVYNESNLVRQTLAELGARNFIDAGAPSPPRLPQIVVTGRFTASPGKDRERIGTTYDFASDWSWLRGRHELKWGAQVQRHGYVTSNNSASSGRFVFDGTFSRNAVADYLLGRVVSFTQNSLLLQGGKYYIPAFYAQDNWKVTPRLTLNLGLRWEIYAPWREDRRQLAMYVPGARSRTFPGAPLGMVYETDPDYGHRTDWANLGPRIGFAWDVFGDGRTSVRGGYAVSYDGLTSEYVIGGNQPFSLSVEIANSGPLSDPYANTRNPFPYTVDRSSAVFTLPATINGHIVGSFQASYNQNASLTIQRQLGRDWMAQVGYVGNFARKLPLNNEFNPAVYIPGVDERGRPLSTTQNTDARRRLAPTYRGFAAASFDANASYNALQAVIRKRLSNGFTLVGHYTFSKAIDEGCTRETLDQCRMQNPFDRRSSRGLSEYDRTHVAVFSYLYELPVFRGRNDWMGRVLGGWQLAGINTFQSGNPLTIVTGRDISLTGLNAGNTGNQDRPDVIGNPRLASDRPTAAKIDRWFDTAAFRQNATGRFGNAGRSIVRGPGSWNWDLSAQKTFRLAGEGHRLEFRSDFFNILNHPNLSEPAVILTTPQSFGKIANSSGARVIQFALRYEF